MDEATSALDSKTEAAIMDTLNVLMKNRTTILIAHRLSTAAHCDQIAVLHKGKVAEIGSHQELLGKQGGRYAAMWMAQQAQKQQPAAAAAAAAAAAGKSNEFDDEEEASAGATAEGGGGRDGGGGGGHKPQPSLEEAIAAMQSGNKACCRNKDRG